MKAVNLPRWLLLTAFAVGVAAAFANQDAFNPARLEQAVREAGPAAPLAYMLLYAAATVLFLPGSVLTLMGGALFGPVAGTFYSLTGATVGAIAAFLAARYAASGWVARKAGGRLASLMDGIDAEGWRFVAFVRLVPLFPFNLLNYALGLTRVRLLDYALTSYLCMAPGAFAYTWLGYAGREAAAGAEGALKSGMVALALLATVAVLPRFMRRLRGAFTMTEGKLSSAQLKQRLDRHDDIAVLDVRSAKDYTGELGHIPGSFNIPLDGLPGRLTELEVHRDHPLAVICRTNRMSGKAVQLLHDAGFKQALLVEDGMLGWQGQGITPSEICSAKP